MSEISTTTGPYSTNLTLNSVLNGFSIKESLPQELSSANSRNSPNLKQKASDSRLVNQRSPEAFEEQVMDMDLELSRNPDCSSVARIVIGNKSDPREQTRKTTSHIPFTDNSLRAPLSRSQSVIQAQNTELSDRHFEKSQMGRSGQPFAAGDFMRQNQKPATKQNPVLVGSERHLSQVEYWNVGKILLCPTCNGNFTGEPEIIFFEHVNACADTAEEEPEENVQYGSLVPVTDDMLRICPMCEAKFDNTVPQADFENHVQNHFNDEFLEVNGFVNVDQ